MKIFKTTIKKFMTIILTVLALLIFNSCEDSIEDEIIPPDSSSSEQLISWNKLLNQLDLESEIAFVQNGESIQEAIDGALPGDIVYIEPGSYSEKISFNKSDLKIIGLSLTQGDLKINSNNENKIDILKLYDQKSTDRLQNKSQNSGKGNGISNFSRTELGRGIVHYQFNVRMGPDDFDVVRIHRVVRESRPYHAIPTKGHVFMIHGAFTGFDGTFLANGLESNDDINAANSSPFYLASKNIDVWGIDMGWTMVPNSTTEFSFMDGWGYEKDAGHSLKALKIARLIRGFSGQGFSALNLLGFSSGNTVAYAAANRETQKRCRMKRHIKGIITVDNAFKVPDGDSGCASAETIAAEIAGGQFQNENGAFFSLLGNLAIGDPEGESPIFGSDFSNIEAFRFAFYTPNVIGFTFFAGDLEGPFYSEEERALKVVSSYSHFMPNLLWQEIDVVNCSSLDVTFDDYLHLIDIPIMYIGAEAGSGSEAGFYTGGLTASMDITNHLVNSIGHVDTVIGNDADQNVWSLLRNWLKNHQ